MFRKKDKPSKKTRAKTHDISEIAKRYGVRVSTPMGYFPEDVDKLLQDLEQQLVTLSKENKHASERIKRLTDERNAAMSELSTLKMQISFTEIPDTSEVEDFTMLSRLATINEKAAGHPEEQTPSKVEVATVEPIIQEKVEDNIAETKDTFDDLVSTSRKKQTTKQKAAEQTKARQKKSVFDLEIIGE